jgi:hypothetical protein
MIIRIESKSMQWLVLILMTPLPGFYPVIKTLKRDSSDRSLHPEQNRVNPGIQLK